MEHMGEIFLQIVLASYAEGQKPSKSGMTYKISAENVNYRDDLCVI